MAGVGALGPQQAHLRPLSVPDHPTVADVSTVLVLSIRAALSGADLAADSGVGLALIIMHTLCIALTLCTNALVTLLVGYRTW